MSKLLPPAMFIADHGGLDFLNTVATPGEAPVEWIGSGEDFLVWLGQSGFVPEEVLREMRNKAAPGELDAIATQARSLREWFRGVVEQYSGQPLPSAVSDDLTPLNTLLARDELFHRVAANTKDHHSGVTLIQERRWRSPVMLLLPIAEAIARLIAEENFTYVKFCEGQHCSLVFLDKTRRHGRRWCSMAVCGNRAKQSAHRSRQK